MRTRLAALIVGLLLADAGRCVAQGTTTSGPRLAGSSLDHLTPKQSSDSPTDVTEVTLKRLLDKWQPIHERVVKDDRLRMLSGVVGLGVLAYEAMPTRSQLPIDFIGTEALRIGLHPQLNMLRERTGYAFEPSVGRRRFVITLRKTLD
jgi:hypothetical protein